MPDESNHAAPHRTPCILVAYVGHDLQTKSIGLALDEHLRSDALAATALVDASEHSLPDPAAYDAVVLGGSVRFGLPPPVIVDYVSRWRDVLTTKPTFVFVVGDPDDLEHLARATGWRPTTSVAFERIARDHRRFLHKLGSHAPSATMLAGTRSARVHAFAETIVVKMSTIESLAASTARG